MTKRRQSPKNEHTLSLLGIILRQKSEMPKMYLCTRKKYQTTLKVKHGGGELNLEYPYDRLVRNPKNSI